MSDSAAVTVTRQGALAVVSVGPGDRTNALGTCDWLALAAVTRELATDDDLGAVVVTGSGRSSFSSGSLVAEWIGAEEAEVDRSFAAMEEALTAVEHLPVPVIAQVRGAALGAGCQLACACDLRVIGWHARIGMPVARWGILTPPAFAARIAVLTGPGVARDLLLRVLRDSMGGTGPQRGCRPTPTQVCRDGTCGGGRRVVAGGWVSRGG